MNAAANECSLIPDSLNDVETTDLRRSSRMKRYVLAMVGMVAFVASAYALAAKVLGEHQARVEGMQTTLRRFLESTQSTAANCTDHACYNECDDKLQKCDYWLVNAASLMKCSTKSKQMGCGDCLTPEEATEAGLSKSLNKMKVSFATECPSHSDLIQTSKYIFYASAESLQHIKDRHMHPEAPGSTMYPDVDLAKAIAAVAATPPTSFPEARAGERPRVVWGGVTSPLGPIGEMGIKYADPDVVKKMQDYRMPDFDHALIKVAPGKRTPTKLVTLVADRLGKRHDGKEVLSLRTMYPGGSDVDGKAIPWDREDFAAAGFYFVLPPSSPILTTERLLSDQQCATAYEGTAAPPLVDSCQLQALKPEDFVDMTIKGSILPPRFDWKAAHRNDNYQQDKPYVFGEKDDMGGWATDFITQEIQGAHSRNNFEFLKIVEQTYQQAIADYVKKTDGVTDRDIMFVFKGGNLIRLYVTTFLRNIRKVDEATADMLENSYKSSFKMSDADFQLAIRPTLKNFDKVHEDMLQITYAVQAHLRAIFLADKKKWFQIYNRKPSEQTERLRHHLETFKEQISQFPEWADVTFETLTLDTMSSDGPLSCPGKNTSQTDMAIVPISGTCSVPGCKGVCKAEQCKELKGTWTPASCEANDCTHHVWQLRAPCDPVSILPISYDDAENWMSGKNKCHFTLIRTKMALALSYKNKDGSVGSKVAMGEFIDVSDYYSDDKSSNVFWSNVDKHTHAYEIRPDTFKDPESDEYILSPFFFERGGWDKLTVSPVLEVVGPSIYELQLDIFNILFSYDYPWQDGKYAKRMDRIMLLCFTELFPMSNTGMDFLEKFLSWLRGGLSSETMPTYHKTDVFYNKLLPALREPIAKAKGTGTGEVEEFMKRLTDNLQVQIKAAKMLSQSNAAVPSNDPYKSNSMYFSEESIDFKSSTSVIGYPVGLAFGVVCLFLYRRRSIRSNMDETRGYAIHESAELQLAE